MVQSFCNDIISIGLVWCTEEEFKSAVEEMGQSKPNTERRDSISEPVQISLIYFSGLVWPHQCSKLCHR